LLRADHRRVEQLFGSFEKASSAAQNSQLATQICTELTIHPKSGSWVIACSGRIGGTVGDEQISASAFASPCG
jgi:hypothetical protein